MCVHVLEGSNSIWQRSCVVCLFNISFYVECVCVCVDCFYGVKAQLGIIIYCGRQ